MKVTRQLNIRDKSGYFFTDVINVNSFGPNKLHADRTVVIYYDFVNYDIKYVKNLNKMNNLYLAFHKLDAVFRKSVENKY